MQTVIHIYSHSAHAEIVPQPSGVIRSLLLATETYGSGITRVRIFIVLWCFCILRLHGLSLDVILMIITGLNKC